MSVRTWLNGAHDAPPDGGLLYLIKFERDGAFHGWQSANASGVIDAIGDQAYASFIDEEPDTITVYRLTEAGVLPVTVKTERCADIGLVCVDLHWRDPLIRGKASHKSERGFYKIFGA